MTNYLQFSKERPASTATLGLFLAATAFETGRAVIDSHRKSVAGVDSYLSEEGPSYLFWGGRGQNLHKLAPIYHRRLGGMGSEHYLYQEGAKYSQNAADDMLAKACERDGDRDRVMVLTSMGTMEGMRSLARPETRAALGKGGLKAIICMSPLTSRADLQPDMVKLLNTSLHTPALPIVRDLHKAYRLMAMNRDIPHSEQTRQDEVWEHYHSSAVTPFGFLKSQDRLIAAIEPWEIGSHLVVAEENPGLEIHQTTAEFDPVVDHISAQQHLEASFGLAVKPWVMTGRVGHADDIEFMEPLVEIASRFSHLNRNLVSSSENLGYFATPQPFAIAS